MKRKISILMVAVLLFALCAAGYTAAWADNPASGHYTLFTLDMLGEQTDPAALGITASIELREDGTGSTVSNGAEVPVSAWAEENGIVTLADAAGNAMELVLRDGILEMEMGPGYYMYFARDGVDTTSFQIVDHTPDSALYGLYQSIDANKGAHLSYEFHSDYMDSTSIFDVHTRNGVYFSLRTTRAGGYEQLNATCFKDGTSYVLYPDEMRGNVATTTSSSIITNNVLMLDDLYGKMYQNALRTDFTVETREIEGVAYTAEVYPAKDYMSETAYYYDDAGTLVHVLVAASQIAPELGETFFTVHAIDEAVNDALFDISGYAIS